MRVNEIEVGTYVTKDDEVFIMRSDRVINSMAYHDDYIVLVHLLTGRWKGQDCHRYLKSLRKMTPTEILEFKLCSS